MVRTPDDSDRENARIGLPFILRFAAASIIGGAALAAMGTWLDDKPYTLERVAQNSALLAAILAIAITLALALNRSR